MENVSYYIPNIHCGHCTMAIKQRLSQIPGVEEVDASVDSREVIVEYESPATEEAIIAALIEINYPPAK